MDCGARPSRRWTINRLVDWCHACGVTLLCWAWFLFGFLAFFSWRYLLYAVVVRDTERFFQRSNRIFYRIFFKILTTAAPRQRIEIDPEAAAIRSAVVVCNHLSYLDPLLLISLFPRHRTVVKPRFFQVPVFGWMIRKSGYFSASGAGKASRLMVAQMESMAEFLEQGGVLFIFPEGTRSRDGKLGPLNIGAMKIARLCQAPVHVLQLRNTEKLFTPGRFLFNTREENTIRLSVIDRIDPDYTKNQPTADELRALICRAYATHQD